MEAAEEQFVECDGPQLQKSGWRGGCRSVAFGGNKTDRGCGRLRRGRCKHNPEDSNLTD